MRVSKAAGLLLSSGALQTKAVHRGGDGAGTAAPGLGKDRAKERLHQRNPE